MAELVGVGDPDDARLGDYRDLRDVELRKSIEVEHGLFIAEGEKVIRRAIDAGYPARSVLLTPRWIDSLRDVLDTLDAPCYVVDPAVAERVSGFFVHRGALASMARLKTPSVDSVLAGARRVMVCEDVVDHTNLGAVFRSAAALGMDGALLSPRCADPLYRRAVKVSMGAVFSLPYARMERWYDGLEPLRREGFRLLALTPRAGSVPIDRVRIADGERVALLLGTEGDGLSPRWLQEADTWVTIPMAGGIDSLNVAAASAVACFALARGVGAA